MDALLLGHSIPDRGIIEPGLGRRGNVLQDDDAENLATYLQVTHHFRRVYAIVGQPLLDDLRAPHFLNIIHTIRPHVITIDTLSNDLAHIGQFSPNEMLVYADRLHELGAELGAPLTIFNAVLPRESYLFGPTPEVFRANAEKLNHIVKTRCTLKDVPYTVFNPMGGMRYELVDKVEHQVSPYRWGTDGTHPDGDGIPLYRKRVRGMLMKHIGKLFP